MGIFNFHLEWLLLASSCLPAPAASGQEQSVTLGHSKYRFSEPSDYP